MSGPFFESTPDTFRKALDRLSFIVRELNAALTFLLDDSVEEPADAALAGAKERLAEDSTLATLVQGAVDLIGIASEQRTRLGRLSPIFDIALIEEGQRLVELASARPVHGRSRAR